MNVSENQKKERRAKVKELVFVKGLTPHAAAKSIGVTYLTVLNDIKYLKAYHTKLALNNSHIAEKQSEKLMRLSDEMSIVKDEFWSIYDDIKKDKIKKYKTLLNKLTLAMRAIDSSNPNEAKEKILEVYTRLEQESRPNYRLRLDTLKSIVERISKEVKILSLFNPQELMSEYISFTTLKELLVVVKQIIFDLVPANKKQYAVDRMSQVDIKGVGGKEIIDVELKK